MVKNLEEIKEILSAYKEQLRERFGVKEIGIFGSYVRGEQRVDSDIDILVELERPIDFFLFIELEEFLSKILQSKVDLVIKKALKPQIKEFILKEVEYV